MMADAKNNLYDIVVVWNTVAAVCLAMDEIGTILGGSNENEKRA